VAAFTAQREMKAYLKRRMNVNSYETDEVIQSPQLVTFAIGAFLFVACLLLAAV
jgi:hypothetical protein